MMSTTLPPQLQERVVCSIIAAAKYEVPVNIVLAVAEIEGGTPGLWSKNNNGTFDVGAMQLNTQYLEDLKKYGITAEDVAQPGCYSYDLAAWRLRGHLQHDQADLWTRAANYHSRTPKYNHIYRADLIKKGQKWGDWLRVHFKTYPVVHPGVAPIQVGYSKALIPQPQTPPIPPKTTPYTLTANEVLSAYLSQNPMRGFS